MKIKQYVEDTSYKRGVQGETGFAKLEHSFRVFQEDYQG